MNHAEDVSRLISLSNDIKELYQSVFILSCIVFIFMEFMIIHLSMKLWMYIHKQQIETKDDSSKVVPTILSMLLWFVLSFYIVMTFLGINKNYIL